MNRLVLAVGLVLLPGFADAAMLRTSLPSHFPAPSAAYRIRDGAGPRRPLRTRLPSGKRTRAVPHRSPTAISPPRSGDLQTVAPQMIHVHDGDTFYVGPEAIRLRGIDTPELGQPRAFDATRRLFQLLHAGPVTIVRRAEDIYGRVVADVYVGDRNVADVLRAEGFAKARAPTFRATWRWQRIHLSTFQARGRPHPDENTASARVLEKLGFAVLEAEASETDSRGDERRVIRWYLRRPA